MTAITSPFRIAGAAGFWGDRNDALLAQVRGGPVDAVMLDYLAEITMSILRRQLARDPRAGFASDFLAALEPALGDVARRDIQVVTNAGGMNPRACGRAVVELARRRGIRGLKVGIVTGDDLFDRIDELCARGVTLANLDTGAALASVRDRLQSANVYLGAAPIADALRQGARIVVTGRCTDSALVLGPLLAHFGWADDDWDRRAAGVIAGHIIECGGQASGGNFAGGWQDVPALADLGYPIVEVEAGGDFVVTKHPGLGGLVTPAVVKEQLVYEIGDPRQYLTPDVTADFTSVRLADRGADRVHVSGARGGPPPPQLKASLSYDNGWKNVATLMFAWPHAERRARAAADLLLARCRKLGIVIDDHRVELLGGADDVLLRLAIRTRDRESAQRFGREIAPLITSGLPGACGGPGFGGRPDPAPIVDFWPALVPRDAVTPAVEVLES
jgi:hypothetical protein